MLAGKQEHREQTDAEARAYAVEKRKGTKGLRYGEAGKGQNQRQQSKQANKSIEEQAEIQSPTNM